VEDQPQTPSAVTAPEKLDRLRKSDIRSHNKMTIYSMYRFSRHFRANGTLQYHKCPNERAKKKVLN
jgi:hypothetical protein